jgi:hypothetical protein
MIKLPMWLNNWIRYQNFILISILNFSNKFQPNEIKVPTRLNSIPAKIANDPKTIISKLNSSNKFQPKK